jgi:hypothetical protein
MFCVLILIGTCAVVRTPITILYMYYIRIGITIPTLYNIFIYERIPAKAVEKSNVKSDIVKLEEK